MTSCRDVTRVHTHRDTAGATDSITLTADVAGNMKSQNKWQRFNNEVLRTLPSPENVLGDHEVAKSLPVMLLWLLCSKELFKFP